MTDLADTDDKYAGQRARMVERHLVARDIRSDPVLQAMLAVPRHTFVPLKHRPLAYRDTALPIGCGQTISQPYMVAFMVEALQLQGGETVLEIGAGSGYGAAVLSRIAAQVHTVEAIAALADEAITRLAALGYDNVTVHPGDGSSGLPEHAPYDAICATAGAPQVPEPLQRQLKVGGRLVIPVGRRHREHLLRITRMRDDRFTTETLAAVSFVPLIGEYGW